MPSYRLITPLLVLSFLLVSGASAQDPHSAPAQPPAANPHAGLPAGHSPVGSAGDMHTASQIAGTAVPTAEGRDLQWTVPGTWSAKPGPSIRKGSYRITAAKGEAELAITAFPGSTGGLEINLNRWRGQVGLAPLPSAELLAATESFEANGLKFTVIDYRGKVNRLVGAIVPFGGNSWFFKLLGPDATVAAAKADYLQFLRSVKAP